MEKNYRYLQFPLCLLMETYKDKDRGLALIIGYGLGHYALSQKHDLQNVARQVVYDYYRNTKRLTDKLHGAILQAERQGRFIPNDDYSGFNGNGTFEAADNKAEMLQLMEADADLRAEAVRYYQFHQASEFLGVSIKSITNTLSWYHEARGIQEAFEAKYGPDAMASVKPSMICEFRDNPDHDMDLLRAYLGIVSMIGYRNFISTNKPAILSRMIGCKNKKAFEQLSDLVEVRGAIEKYSKRYNMDKLLLTLAERKFIMFLSKKQTSVIYVSRYMEPKELAKRVLQSRNKYSLKKTIADATASL